MNLAPPDANPAPAGTERAAHGPGVQGPGVQGLGVQGANAHGQTTHHGRGAHERAAHGPSARLGWALRALAMPLSALVHMPRVITSPKLDGAGERFRAAATLLRLRLTRMAWMLRQAAGGRI